MFSAQSCFSSSTLACSFWRTRASLAHIAGMVLLGLLYQPINGGACTFFIFAAAMLPFCVETQTAAVAACSQLEPSERSRDCSCTSAAGMLFYSALFPVIIGAGNTFFAERNRMNRQLRKANEEIEHLAKVAERERIARDLHDVLGHTLSVITLKSELAGKLIDRDPHRAGKEIREVEEISRQALSEVRDAIRGYRSKGLVAELAQAKSTLETAGVAVSCDASTTMKLPAVQESVLTMAVREAVTNVVRHAQARTCSSAAGAAERLLPPRDRRRRPRQLSKRRQRTAGHARARRNARRHTDSRL